MYKSKIEKPKLEQMSNSEPKHIDIASAQMPQNPMLNEGMGSKGAVFSDCRKYRYSLWRFWDKSKPLIMFIGLNPSTANEDKDDATIRRVISMAKQWGYGGVYMMNCFPFISTDPIYLKDCGNIKENDCFLQTIGELCECVVFAWGSFDIVVEKSRDIALTQMFPNAKALIKNKDGSPRHPLYVPSTVELVKW
jgi:hypothetical protein